MRGTAPAVEVLRPGLNYRDAPGPIGAALESLPPRRLYSWPVPSRLATIALDAHQPEVVADFWCAVLGWVVVEQSDEGTSIGAADGSWPTIDMLPVPESKTVKNRLHLDLRADGTTTEAELDRLLGLGATRIDVGQSADATWVVLADPEGNEFCLLATAVQDVHART